MTTVVEVSHLTKRFGAFTALNDVSFRLEEHGIYGLLGRNGAGKTTIMQLLTGQDFATSGDIRVFGQKPVEIDARDLVERRRLVEGELIFALRLHLPAQGTDMDGANFGLGAGDERGAEALLRHYAPLMRYIIAPIVPDAQDREECLSDAALRVWEKFGTYDPARGSWTAWLTALTRNTALNRARKKLCIALLKSGNFSDRFPSKQGKGCEA